MDVRKSSDMAPGTGSLPLTDVVYAVLGLNFLKRKAEGFTQIARDLVYVGIKSLVDRHPEYFPNVYFRKRGRLMHSKSVEDTLFRLGGVLTVRNPRHQYLSFNDSELPHVEKIIRERFSPSIRAIIEQLADEFYEKVKEEEEWYAKRYST